MSIKKTVNFIFDEFTAPGSVKAICDTSVEKGDDITPEIIGMVSNTFADDKVGGMALS